MGDAQRGIIGDVKIGLESTAESTHIARAVRHSPTQTANSGSANDSCTSEFPFQNDCRFASEFFLSFQDRKTYTLHDSGLLNRLRNWKLSDMLMI